MSMRQNPNYTRGVPWPQGPTRQRTTTTRPTQDNGPARSQFPATNRYRYGPEPVVFNNPIPFDNDAVYHALTRRDSDASVSVHLALNTTFASTGKFPGGIEESGFAYSGFPFSENAVYMPSIASSVTGRSTISRASSGDSVCSPVLTEPTPEPCSGGSSSSRVPSPLRQCQTTTQSPNTVDVSQRKNTPAEQSGSGKSHICLWGARGGVCESRGFSSRGELNRHVKMEHLLECPVPDCTETVFETRDLLTCHMQWDHGGKDNANTSVCRTSNLLGPGLAQPHNALPIDSPVEKAVVNRLDATEDKVLKMEMSIGISKKRCREQLRTVLEKRLRRANGLPKSADSPGVAVETRTLRLFESASFPVIWEHGVLPFLIEFIPKWCGPGHIISVIRGRKPNTRRICFMTRRPVTTARRIVIAAHIRDLLPETHRSAVSFIFSVGKVDRLVWSRGLGKEMPDEVCMPRNPFAYISPCMGDSIGASLDDGEEATATLGPCVTAEGGSYWLACFHPFIGASQRTSPLLIEHPSPQDQAQCAQEQHDVLDVLDHRIGNLTATSGFNLKTTRITHDPYWDDFDKEPPLVVTDWILISSGTRQANLLRKFPHVAQRRETPVTATSSVPPGANVISTGRTSGLGRGQVCEIPAYVDSQDNGTGKATREWFIEEPFPHDNENEWIRGGIGVEGDSGAAIIDSDTNALVGQLWGRNKYWGPGPRMTFFTPISDIFDDIQEKCGMSARPQLPQYRDEAERWPVYPVCRQCYDVREYLDSRRSSRESLMSMIGAHDVRGEHDNDQTSVSELATPKDHSSLLRHIGPEEISPSFSGGSSVVSPAPIHAFYPFSSAPSPGVSELRSPYPHALSDEDLYESSCPQASEAALGKRPALLPPQGQGTTQHSDKRRRPIYANRV